MTREEIEKEAMRGNAMPKGLSLYQQQYYMCMRLLYRMYRSKAISRDEAKREKAELITAYDVGELHDRCGEINRMRRRAVDDLAVRVNRGEGCELCRRIVRTLDGRDSCE